MARKRKGRDIHGVLLLDKSIHMTSNDVLQKVKRIFDAKKAGHTGALDPLATGMLPICFGESTKFSQYLLDSDKRYRVIARLGQRTDTSDSDGRIIQEKEVHITTDDILNGLKLFSGEIQQIPTMFSALKYQGRPLYDYARQGITVERESRPITIYENRFISFNNNELELEIHCSKGTYIRTIIDDLGESLGCGAHVIYLRRLQVSNYPYDKIISLSFLEENRDNIELLDSLLLPVDSPIQDYPKLLLSDVESNDILLGRSITLSDIPKQENNPIFRLYCDNIFIGIGKLSDRILSPKRLIQTESA